MYVMKKACLPGLFLLILFFYFLAGDSIAFNIPEKLVFDLTWTGIKAGTATLEVVNDKDCIKIISTARSAKWVSVFYTVDDRAETVLVRTQSKAFVGKPRNYHLKIREGRHRRDKEVIFDHQNRTAVFIDHLDGDKKNFDITESILDPLSSFFYVRTLKLEVGKSVFVDMFDSKKMWNVEVQVLRKEKIETAHGNLDTVVIKPLMKSEGIFNRKGDVIIWLTDDHKRIPVKMQTKVAVGSITATLVEGYY